jgi:hypothetical protein
MKDLKTATTQKLMLRQAAIAALFAMQTCCCLAARYPTPLVTNQDIAEAPAQTDSVSISRLPLASFPLLAKCSGLKQINFYKQGEIGASDEKLKALSMMTFTNLQEISLVGSKLVTDQGVRALSKMKSLKTLALEGTSITDLGAKVLSTEMSLSGVAVPEVRGVTYRGLKTMLNSDTLKRLTFSASQATQDEILNLIDGASTNVNRIEIRDREGKLDEARVKAKGSARKIKVFVLTKNEFKSILD